MRPDYFHIPLSRPTEVDADNASQWGDMQEVITTGGFPGGQLAPDRQAIVFPSPQEAQEALSELKNTTTA